MCEHELQAIRRRWAANLATVAGLVALAWVLC